LTASERRRRSAGGQTNRDIAQTLYVTPKTVSASQQRVPQARIPSRREPRALAETTHAPDADALRARAAQAGDCVLGHALDRTVATAVTVCLFHALGVRSAPLPHPPLSPQSPARARRHRPLGRSAGARLHPSPRAEHAIARLLRSSPPPASVWSGPNRGGTLRGARPGPA
jgi:hypothetical protein